MTPAAEWSPERRRHLTRFLRMFMREARWLLRRNRGTDVGPRGDRCRNCAFQPGTDSQGGFESTAWSLLQALLDGRPFWCHSGMTRVAGVGYIPPADPAALRPCAGWLAIAEVGPGARKRVNELAQRAAARAGEPPA